MAELSEKVVSLKNERGEHGHLVSLPINNERAKVEVNGRRIKGYAIIWGSKNDYNEIVLPGATLRSIESRGPESEGKNQIVLLYQHRRDQPIGVIDVLKEDETGLYFEAELTKGVRAADEALNMIRQGTLKQLSYGFNYIWDKVEWDDGNEAYILREIKLWEISLVTFSSDENAQLRSFNEYQQTAKIQAYSETELKNFRSLLDTFINSGPAASTPPKEQEQNNSKPTFF